MRLLIYFKTHVLMRMNPSSAEMQPYTMKLFFIIREPIIRIKLFLLLMIGALGSANADTALLSGKVVKITDGDTLVILDEQYSEIRVRLAAIDAPEKGMPFGLISRVALSDLCFQKSASVVVTEADRYGRMVGIVTCNGINANDEQVREGMAWVYRKYAKGYDHLYLLENQARLSKAGLWSDLSPIPPWEWRHRKPELGG